MTEYDIYLVNTSGFNDTLGMIDTVEASSPVEARRKGREMVEEGGDRILTSAGFNVHVNTDEIKDSIRVYPSSYRSGV